MPRRVRFEQAVPASPAVIAAHLRKQTRWSPLPFQGSPLTFGPKPLKGTIKDDVVDIGLNHRDLLQMLQPTARLTLDQQADGSTRVHGEVGVPPLMVWLLRLITGIVAPLAVSAAIMGALSASWAIALGVGVVMSVGLVVGVGISVSHADGQIDDLVVRIEDALATHRPPPTADPQRDARKGAQQASARLRQ